MSTLTKSNRARFTVSGNSVTLTAENWIGDLETTTYFVSSGTKGGYVRIRDKEGRYPQVCDHLHTTGPTLWATVDTLADVIRREYRAARAAEKRQGHPFRVR